MRGSGNFRLAVFFSVGIWKNYDASCPPLFSCLAAKNLPSRVLLSYWWSLGFFNGTFFIFLDWWTFVNLIIFFWKWLQQQRTGAVGQLWAEKLLCHMHRGRNVGPAGFWIGTSEDHGNGDDQIWQLACGSCCVWSLGAVDTQFCMLHVVEKIH